MKHFIRKLHERWELLHYISIHPLKMLMGVLLGLSFGLSCSCTFTLPQNSRKITSSYPSGGYEITIVPPRPFEGHLAVKSAPTAEYINGMYELKRISRLIGKKNRDSTKNKEYQQKIQEEYDKLYKKREQRITWKLTFLQDFYKDLYQMTPKEFSRKYKKHCSNELTDILKNMYQESHNEQKGHFWYMFGDNAVHKREDIKITNIKYADHNKKDIKDFYPIMYGDSCQWKNDTKPYCHYDPWWYQVHLGSNTVMVQLIGMDKFVVITGLINPSLHIAVHEPQRPCIHYLFHNRH